MLEEHTALYSELDRNYQQAYSGPYEDLSFEADEIQVIAALKNGRITGFGRPVVCFGDKKAQKFHAERLWSISNDIQFQDYLVNGEVSEFGRFLLKKGYKAVPYYAQVIDLTISSKQQKAGLRKSYKSLVAKNTNVHLCSIERLKELHYIAAGRKTRSDETWEIQGLMLEQDQAMIMCKGLRPIPDSAALFYHNDYCAYYDVAASLDGCLSHPVIWAAMCYYTYVHRVKFLDMGEQHFSGDEKLVNISKFKRGFGGTCRVRLNIGKDTE